MVEGADAIVDAMDNLHTRYVLNKAAIKKNIPFFHGAVRAMDGRVIWRPARNTAAYRAGTRT